MDSAQKALEAIHTSQRTCHCAGFIPFLSDLNEDNCCNTLVSVVNLSDEEYGGAFEEYYFYSNGCNLPRLEFVQSNQVFIAVSSSNFSFGSFNLAITVHSNC